MFFSSTRRPASSHRQKHNESPSKFEYHPLLAGYTQDGIPWVNEEVRKKLGQEVYDRILLHQTVFLREITKIGTSWTEARQQALTEEHHGLSQEEISRYEGRLGALELELKRKCAGTF